MTETRDRESAGTATVASASSTGFQSAATSKSPTGSDAETRVATDTAKPVLLVTTAFTSCFQHTHEGALHPNLGRLLQPRHYSRLADTAAAGMPFAFDNDCFQGLDEPAYRKMLDAAEPFAKDALFVTVPDVVGDALATARLFEHWQPELRARGFPVALVLQDGLEKMPSWLEATWDRVDAVFVGGTTEFKLSEFAAELAREAKRRGKWVHWGRVNSKRRFDYCVSTGACDSFDGSKWARWRKTYLDQGLAWCLAEADKVTNTREETP